MISFLSSLLAAAMPINTGSIASNAASYDGSSLHLEGEVALEHGLGTMKAEEAVLTRQEQDQAEFPFSYIELVKAVSLALSTDARVECEKAVLDFSTLKGVLTSPQEVHYVDVIKHEDNSTPFELFTPHLDLQMMEDAQKKGAYEIELAHATEGVHLIYNKLYHLQTESILFSKKTILSEGINPCVWTYQNDRVDAAQFNLDLENNQLLLKKASGHLSSFCKGEMQFTADLLDWRHTDHHLVLQGSPQVQESSLGKIISEQEINLTLKDQKVHHLITTGQTTLTSQKGHRLTTQGSLEVDGDKQIAVIRPPPTGENIQLLYEEEEMTIRADEAQIHYREDDQGLHPSSVELQGHITIFSQEKEGPSRRGVAETLTYDPATRSCILKAAPGQKVLFMRDQDSLCISANEVHITYDPVSKEQQIRGIGHVILSLSPEEQHLLNQVFRHAPSPSKS